MKIKGTPREIVAQFIEIEQKLRALGFDEQCPNPSKSNFFNKRTNVQLTFNWKYKRFHGTWRYREYIYDRNDKATLVYPIIQYQGYPMAHNVLYVTLAISYAGVHYMVHRDILVAECVI